MPVIHPEIKGRPPPVRRGRMSRSKKKRTPASTGCSRCGSPYARVSGLERCSNTACGYCPSTSTYRDYDLNRPIDQGWVAAARDMTTARAVLSPHPKGPRSGRLVFK